MGHKVGDSALVKLLRGFQHFFENSHIGRWNGDEILVA